MALLEVSDLQTIFRSPAGVVRAVDGVSFSLDAGRTLGLVGESGCGKSATALSLVGLLPGNARIVGGAVRFEERNLVGQPSSRSKVRGREIAMIFQDPMTSLNPTVTIGVQIGEALRRHLGHGAATRRAAGPSSCSRRCGPAAERRVNDYPHVFSGGMRQRVMIAIALSCSPSC